MKLQIALVIGLLVIFFVSGCTQTEKKVYDCGDDPDCFSDLLKTTAVKCENSIIKHHSASNTSMELDITKREPYCHIVGKAIRYVGFRDIVDEKTLEVTVTCDMPLSSMTEESFNGIFSTSASEYCDVKATQ